MRVLFDHNIPSGTARALTGHRVTEATERGWQSISNGQLIANAEEAGFDVFLTGDKRIRYQQNLTARRIAIVVVGNPTRRVLRKHLERVAAAVDAATPCSYVEVEIPFE
jgi:hypothetical protein